MLEGGNRGDPLYRIRDSLDPRRPPLDLVGSIELRKSQRVAAHPLAVRLPHLDVAAAHRTVVCGRGNRRIPLRESQGDRQYCPPCDRDDPASFWSEPMTNAHHEQRGRSWLKLILSDVHFWIPIAVLIGGLLVLSWIQ